MPAVNKDVFIIPIKLFMLLIFFSHTPDYNPIRRVSVAKIHNTP